MRTIAQIRKHDDIAQKLCINEVKLGQSIYKKNMTEEERSKLTKENMISD